MSSAAEFLLFNANDYWFGAAKTIGLGQPNVRKPKRVAVMISVKTRTKMPVTVPGNQLGGHSHAQAAESIVGSQRRLGKVLNLVRAKGTTLYRCKEQKTKIRANPASKPETMVFFPHSKDNETNAASCC